MFSILSKCDICYNIHLYSRGQGRYFYSTCLDCKRYMSCKVEIEEIEDTSNSGKMHIRCGSPQSNMDTVGPPECGTVTAPPLEEVTKIDEDIITSVVDQATGMSERLRIVIDMIDAQQRAVEDNPALLEIVGRPKISRRRLLELFGLIVKALRGIDHFMAGQLPVLNLAAVQEINTLIYETVPSEP